MAGNMNLIAKKCFPKTDIVTDRFHVQKLTSEAVQEERIRLRWEIIEVENKAIEDARKTEKIYKPELLSNGDTHRQLLARSRYLLFKSKTKWIKANCCVYANILVNLKRKNSTFLTPLNCALNAFIFALKDSAEAFVLLLIK